MKKDGLLHVVAMMLAMFAILLAAGAATGQMASANAAPTIRHLMAISAVLMAAAAFAAFLGLWRAADWGLLVGKLCLAALILFTIVFMNVSDTALAASHTGWFFVLLEIGSLSGLVYASGIQSASTLDYPPGMLG